MRLLVVEISKKYLPVQVKSTPSAGQRGLLWQVNGLTGAAAAAAAAAEGDAAAREAGAGGSVGFAIELSNPNGVIKTSCTPLTLDPAGATYLPPHTSCFKH